MIRRLGAPGMHGMGGMALADMATAGAAAAVANGLLNSLIAYWPGDEVNGDALDLHTNALHLTDANTVTSNPGLVYALARQYTAANAERHVRPGDDALLSAGDTDLTVASWVYLDSKPAGGMAIVGKHDGASIAGSEYLLTWETGPDRFTMYVYQGGAVWGGVTANTFGAPGLGVWIHTLCWHDSVANTINIQINDGGVDSAGFAGGMNDTATPFRIGSTGGGGLWDGRIGPTAVWKSAGGGGGVLSVAQKTALHNIGGGLTYAAFTL